MELLKELQTGDATLPGVPAPVNPETGEADTYIKYGYSNNRY
jgi:hypothetical protein